MLALKSRRSIVAAALLLAFGAAALAACDPGTTAVAAAQRELGVRYTYGGTTRATGFDCSGLTSYAWKQAGVTIPRTAAEQHAWATKITKAQLQPGDLVFFSATGPTGSVSHVGLYEGGGKMIHASSGDGRVEEVTLATYWTGHLVGYGRVKGVPQDPTTTSTTTSTPGRAR